MPEVNLKKITDSFFIKNVYIARTRLKVATDYRLISTTSKDSIISIDIPFLLKAEEKYFKLPKTEISVPREKIMFFSHFPFAVFLDTKLTFNFKDMKKEITFYYLSPYIPNIEIENGQITFLLTFFVALKGLT
ncbi:MAG: hypothetical protein LWW95_11950 [Candidatus Desulfofervidus auxilii]|nr:hypothetical protein [Candidatus Desulfofervidus auxilii]